MTSEAIHRHKSDDTSVVLSHLHLDCLLGMSACLVAPSFYFDEERTKLFLAREVNLYLGSSAGRANFAPLVFDVLEHYKHDRFRHLGQPIARAPKVLARYLSVLTVLTEEIDLGKRGLDEAIRRAQFRRPVSKPLRDKTSRLSAFGELMRFRKRATRYFLTRSVATIFVIPVNQRPTRSDYCKSRGTNDLRRPSAKPLRGNGNRIYFAWLWPSCPVNCTRQRRSRSAFQVKPLG